MAWAELVEKRGQKVKHFYDADTDKYRAEFTIHDRHYKDEFDDWLEVDENFEDGGVHDKKCDKTRHAIHVGNGGARRWYPRRNVSTEYVDITNIQYYSNQWRNLNLPTPAWTNNTTEWDLSYLYASITNTWRRIKTDFILKNDTAPTRLRFVVSFTGLTYNDTTGELTSTTDGLVWGYIQKPTAKDANDADVTVTQTYDGTYIEWSVDTTGATFPIYVDPTFTDGYGQAVNTAIDTSLLSGADANKNYGVGGVHIGRGLLRFDCSSISSAATCDSATIYLYVAYADTSSANYYSIASANNDWIEGIHNDATATANEPCWNYRKYNTVNWAGSVGCSTSGTDYEASSLGTVSVEWNDPVGTEKASSLTASRIEDWFGVSNTNYGLLLNSEAGAWFASAEDATTAYRPKLVVEYEEGGCTVETIVSMIIAQSPVITVVAMEG